MGGASWPLSPNEPKPSKFLSQSTILAWDCPHSRQTNSSTHSLPPSHTAQVWDCLLADPSLSRMAAACGLPTTLPTEQVFVSLYPPGQRQRNEPARHLHGIRR